MPNVSFGCTLVPPRGFQLRSDLDRRLHMYVGIVLIVDLEAKIAAAGLAEAVRREMVHPEIDSRLDVPESLVKKMGRPQLSRDQPELLGPTGLDAGQKPPVEVEITVPDAQRPGELSRANTSQRIRAALRLVPVTADIGVRHIEIAVLIRQRATEIPAVPEIELAAAGDLPGVLVEAEVVAGRIAIEMIGPQPHPSASRGIRYC